MCRETLRSLKLSGIRSDFDNSTKELISKFGNMVIYSDASVDEIGITGLGPQIMLQDST